LHIQNYFVYLQRNKKQNKTKHMKVPEIKISFKMDKVKPSELYKVESSAQGCAALRQIFNADTFAWTEEAIVLCLNRANKVIGFYKLSSGGVSGTIMDPKVVFTVALNCGASSIILAHNHPSGNLQPSQSDKDVTEKIKAGGKLLEITLLDHIIVTEEGYLSFADEGLI
jgi:DNA repair protein RadC